MNRNYPYKFAQDSEGSSDDPCDETYRGAAPFSEPETQAIRNLVLKSRKISTAINFHAYGNLWINPYSYYNQKDVKLLFDSNVYDFYENYHQDLRIKGFKKVGTAIEVINYVANGDAGDWLLAEHGILNLSPELGSNDKNSEQFYLNSEQIIKVVDEGMIAVQKWLDYHTPIFSKIQSTLKKNETAFLETKKQNQAILSVYKLTIKFKNLGIVDLRSLSLLLSFGSIEDASKLVKIDFNQHMESSKYSFEYDKSSTKIKIKEKLFIHKLSENFLILELSGKIESQINLSFFKLNKEVARIVMNDEKIQRLFGQSWFQTPEFKIIFAFFIICFLMYLVYRHLGIVENKKRASYQRANQGEDVQNIEVDRVNSDEKL